MPVKPLVKSSQYYDSVRLVLVAREVTSLADGAATDVLAEAEKTGQEARLGINLQADSSSRLKPVQTSQPAC